MNKHKTQKGSALLVTLLAMSLLLVLTLSLVAVVRMELRTVTQHQQLLAARANARLGAELAIARLQELTGADSRITLPASADSGLDQAALEEPQRRTGNWTAVRDAAILRPDGNGGQEWNPDQGALQGWLVSGNTPNLETVNAWSGLQTPAPGFSMLVGPGSTDVTPGSGAAEYVAAPLVDISGAGPLEDFSAVGRYAWWIGDEGVKARVNLSDPFLLDGQSSTDAYRALTVQRTGTEVFMPNHQPDSAEQQAQMARVDSVGNLNLVDFTGGEDVARGHFHEITTHSMGLPVNVPYGGLRKNLTAVFQEAWNAGGDPVGTSSFERLQEYQQVKMDRLERLPRDPFRQYDPSRHRGGIRPDQNDSRLVNRIFPHMSEASAGDEHGSPSWNQLIQWVNTRRLNPNFQVRRNSINEQGLWPVMAKIEWGRYITFDRLESPTRVFYTVVPRMVMWNPYNVPLRLDDFHMRWIYDPREFPIDILNLVVSRTEDDGSGPETIYEMLNRIHLSFVVSSTASSPGTGYANWNTSGYFDFTLRGETIPPGAAMVFTMTESHNLMGSGTVGFMRNGVWHQNLNPVIWHLDINGHDPVELRSVANPGNYGFTVQIDLDDLVRRIAADPTRSNWPSNTSNNHYQVNGLNGVTLEASGGGDETTLTFRQYVNWVGQGATLSIEMDSSWDNIGRSFREGHIRGGDRFSTIMMRGIPFTLPSFRFAPEDFVYTPATTEIEEQYRLYHFVLGLRLPYNFAQDFPNARANQIAPSKFLTGMNPLTNRIGMSRVDNRLTRGYGGMNTHIGMMMQKDSDLQFVSYNGRSFAFIGYSDSPAEIGGPLDRPYPRFIATEVPGSVFPDSPWDEIASPASLQHANLRSFNNAIRNTSEVQLFMRWNHPGGNLGPAHPIGNSRLDPLLGSERAYRTAWRSEYDSEPLDFNVPDNHGHSLAAHYDYSYLLNQALWDDFTFTPRSNSRIVWDNPDWNEDPAAAEPDFDQAESRFLTAGALNVHSTSVAAWSALLRSLEAVPVDGEDADFNGGQSIPLSRFSGRFNDPFDPDGRNRLNNQGFSHENNFTGYRRLTRAEADRLAEEIVNQVRERGPFFSMADFVNRRLMPEGGDPLGHGVAGAIQTAIDRSGINDAQADRNLDPRSMVAASDFPEDEFDPEFRERSAGPVTEGVAGFLTQADVLSRIGAALQVRSDTFTIRTHGQALAPGGEVMANAWAEVVVQRIPDFVDDSNAAHDEPLSFTPINQRFGRRYEIKRFRWLSEDEI
jgi:hypothetical protein